MNAYIHQIKRLQFSTQTGVFFCQLMFNLLALLLRVITSFIDPRTVVKLITMVEILRLSIRLCDNAWVIWLGAGRARQPI